MTSIARQSTRAPNLDDRFAVPLRGVRVAPDTRCAHFDASRDIIAIRFACCDVYYPCYECHRATTEHDEVALPTDQRRDPSVLCGVCGATLSAEAYLTSDHQCPRCQALFNPGCAAHHDRYFSFA